MRKNLLAFLLLPIAMLTIISLSNCKKDKANDNTNATATTGTTSQDFALIIENGAQVIAPGETLTYKAHLVGTDGKTVAATGVAWSSSSSTVATISAAGTITTVSSGQITVTATITYNEKKYTANAPLGVYAPSVFSVAPAAILYEKGGLIQLESIKLSTGGVEHPACTYTSSNEAVATVSTSGLVTCVAPGSCLITVNATSLNGVVNVPVEVIGVPTIALPVTKITIDPASKDLFRGETQQLTAKAYKSSNEEVSGKSFTWTSLDPTIATVSSSGLVTPVKPGEVSIQASVDGIIGQADIIVNPDTMVLITPFYKSIAQGGTQQFTAKAYVVKRNSADEFTAQFDWSIPSYPGASMLNVASVTSSGLVTIKSDAIIGMSTILVATIKNNPNAGGAAVIMVEVPGVDIPVGPYYK